MMQSFASPLSAKAVPALTDHAKRANTTDLDIVTETALRPACLAIELIAEVIDGGVSRQVAGFEVISIPSPGSATVVAADLDDVDISQNLLAFLELHRLAIPYAS